MVIRDFGRGGHGLCWMLLLATVESVVISHHGAGDPKHTAALRLLRHLA